MKISKRLVIMSIFAVLALPLVGAVDASAQNLLVNGDFETGDLTGWLVFGESDNAGVTVEAPNGPSLPGMYSAYMANNAETTGLNLKQSTAAGSAGPGMVYYAYDLLLVEANVGGVLFIEVFAEQENGGVVGGSGLIGPIWAWDVYTHFEGSFEAPANTDFLTIQIVPTTGAAEGTNCLVYVDNVYLSQDGGPVAEDSATWDGVKALYR